VEFAIRLGFCALVISVCLGFSVSDLLFLFFSAVSAFSAVKLPIEIPRRINTLLLPKSTSGIAEKMMKGTNVADKQIKFYYKNVSADGL